MKSTSIFIVAIILIIGGYYYLRGSTAPSESADTTPTSPAIQSPALQGSLSGDLTVKTYSKDEVATHNSASDCWLIIDGGVYDITGFIAKHPGGQIITLGCGKDASIFFHARGEKKEEHSDKAVQTRETLRIGNLAE